MKIFTLFTSSVFCLYTSAASAQLTYAPKDERTVTIEDIAGQEQLDAKKEMNQSMDNMSRHSPKTEIRDVIINNEALKRRTAHKAGENPPAPVRVNLNSQKDVKRYLDKEIPEAEELNLDE